MKPFGNKTSCDFHFQMQNSDPTTRITRMQQRNLAATYVHAISLFKLNAFMQANQKEMIDFLTNRKY